MTVRDDPFAWQRDAACREHPEPGLWFPVSEDSRDSPTYAICARCPVRDVCLEHALEHGERYGIWGGKSERERVRLMRRRQRARQAARRADRHEAA